MTKYLSMNGTSDYLQLPSITFDTLELDFSAIPQANDYLLDARAGAGSGYFFRDSNNINDTVGSSWVNVYLNGTQVTKGTPIIPNNTRCLIRLEAYNASGYTDDITIFARNTFANPMQGNIYDLKIYKSGVLVAHYDMSTGTVNDQSGNGNNATLNGGTWLDSGGATGTPVTYTYDTKQIQYANIQTTYDTKQSIYANVNLSADTKQSIYANRVTQFDTKQSIYKPINQSYDTKQAIYKAIQELFDTEQVFTQVSNQVSYTYDMKIQQYKEIQESVDTKQAYYTDISVDLDTKQVIYKQIQNLYDTLIQIRNTHDETLYGTLTIQRVIEHRLTINKRRSEDLKIERVLNHILRV